LRNFIMTIISCSLVSIAYFSFAEDKQNADLHVSSVGRAQEKVVFDHKQAVYDDRANKDLRAQNIHAKKTIQNRQYNNKVQAQQDKDKGQFIVKF